MVVAFWLALAVVAYVYVGYPALLTLWARVASRPVERRLMTPSVSVVLVVRNEAAVLRARIENLLSLDYPEDLLQIIAVSDGSTDGTASILRDFEHEIDIVLLPPGGKARALNAGVALAEHDVLVFADARQVFAPDAVRALVAPLADPRVGGVSGALVLDVEAGDTSGFGDGVGAYWRFEKWLRSQESLIGSTIGATGAIHAMRRDLWRPLPPETILDDVLAPMRVVLAGYRVVFEDGARAYDRATSSAPDEFRRKSRTLAGNYQLLRFEPKLLVPWFNPIWVQFVSHKMGRLLVPYALVVLLITSGVLALASWLYAVAFACQLAFYGLAGYGAALERDGLEQRAASHA
jgi:cellulose synthase/poly-beta-1,6-N-acetylglucosamine synthase-like glycosyltransferase